MHNTEDTPSCLEVVEESKPTQKNESDKQKHLRFAKLLLAKLGKENVVFHVGCFWLWRNALWEKADDRELKKAIHEIAKAEKLTKSFVDSVLDLAKTEAFRFGHEFDPDRSGINVSNGTLHWIDSNWVLRPHRREDYRTTMLPVAYDETATAPRFLKFLDEIFAYDEDGEDKKRLVLEAIGYSMTTSTEYEKFFMLAGDGSNGKSVLLYVLRALVGKKNTSAVQPSQFDNRFQRAHMHGKLANIITELPKGSELHDAATKAIVSGEATTVEHKHKDPFDVELFTTLWIGTNHIPTTNDFSDALFRRAIIIPFTRQFSLEERDVKLKYKLAALELSGILNLALDAYGGVIQRGGFTVPDSVEEAINNWKSENDPVRGFACDCIEEDRNATGEAATLSADYYRAFVTFCEEEGVPRIPKQKAFTVRLCKVTAGTSGRSNKGRTIEGIRLITENQDDED